MRVERIEYSELRSCGNYDNIKIGVVVELDGTDSPIDAIAKAQLLVRRQLEKSHKRILWTPMEIEEARKVVSDPLTYNGTRIDWAKKVVADADSIMEYDVDPFFE